MVAIRGSGHRVSLQPSPVVMTTAFIKPLLAVEPKYEAVTVGRFQSLRPSLTLCD